MKKRTAQKLTRPEFGSITQGKRLHGRYFSLRVAPLIGDTAKFACVVSTKVARRAVERNRIKRRCRMVAQNLFSSEHTSQAFVFYAKREALEATYEDVKRDMTDLLSRV